MHAATVFGGPPPFSGGKPLLRCITGCILALDPVPRKRKRKQWYPQLEVKSLELAIICPAYLYDPNHGPLLRLLILKPNILIMYREAKISLQKRPHQNLTGAHNKGTLASPQHILPEGPITQNDGIKLQNTLPA